MNIQCLLTEYQYELQKLDNRWLLFAEKEFGPPKVLILSMRFFQQNKTKVRTVLDFHELTYIAHTDISVQN